MYHGYTTKTGAEDPEIIDVKKSSQQQEVKATGNTLKVVVSYLDKTGKQLTKEVNVTAFAGTDWSEPKDVKLLLNSAEIKNNQIVASETRYKLSNFTLADGSFEGHGAPAAPKVASVTYGTTTISDEAEFIITSGTAYTFTITYADGTTEGAETTVVINGVSGN